MSVKWHNFDWMYEKNGLLFKFPQDRPVWNGKAELIKKIEKLINHSGIEIYLHPCDDGEAVFAVGISHFPLRRIIYYDDFQIGILIDSINGKIKFRTYYEEITEFDYDKTKGHKIVLRYDDGVWRLIYDQQVKARIPDFIKVFPLKIQVISKINDKVPIDLEYRETFIEKLKIVETYPEVVNGVGELSYNQPEIKFKFNKNLNPDTVSGNVFVRENIQKDATSDFDISVNKNYIIFKPKKELQHGAYYLFIFTDGLKGSDGSIHDYEDVTFKVKELKLEYDQLFKDWNKNPLDVYFQEYHIGNLIDIDNLLKHKKEYNFVYFHTDYDPVYDKFIVDENKVIKVENYKELLRLYIRQSAFVYENYFQFINEDEFIKLFIKNIVKNNMFKGTKQQLTFIVSTLGMANNWWITEADADPYYVAHYRINSSVPEDIYKGVIRGISKIVGFKDFYFEIPPTGPKYLGVGSKLDFMLVEDRMNLLKYFYLDVFLASRIDKKVNYSNEGSVFQEDTVTHWKHGFSKNKYQVKLNYDSYELWKEIFMSNPKIEKIQYFDKLSYRLDHKAAEGIGFKFYLELWEHGVLKQIYESDFSKFEISDIDPGNYEVILRIESGKFILRIPVSYLNYTVPRTHVNVFSKNTLIDVSMSSKVQNTGLDIHAFDFPFAFRTSLMRNEFTYGAENNVVSMLINNHEVKVIEKDNTKILIPENMLGFKAYLKVDNTLLEFDRSYAVPKDKQVKLLFFDQDGNFITDKSI